MKRFFPIGLGMLMLSVVLFSCQKEDLPGDIEKPETPTTNRPDFPEIPQATANDFFNMAFVESNNYGDYSLPRELVVFNSIDQVKCSAILSGDNYINDFALSPSRKKWAYTGDKSIVVYDSCGAAPRTLDLGGADAQFLQWINETELLFTEGRYSPSSNNLWLGKIDVETGMISPILDRGTISTDEIYSISLSYDQQKIAFSANQKMWVIGIDGQGLEELDLPCIQGKWAPNSYEILCNIQEYDQDCYTNSAGILVCTVHGLERSDLIVYDYLNQSKQVLDGSLIYRKNITWHPNGQAVFYTESVDGCYQVNKVDLVSGDQQMLYCESSYISNLSFSEQEQKLYFSDIYSIYRIDATGDNLEEVYRFEDLSDAVKWFWN